MARESRRAARERMRDCRSLIIRLFGGRCEHCGCSDARVLCLDHVGDDGATHRREHPTNSYMWAWSNLTEAAKTLQLLCANCNLIKQIERAARLAEAA